MRWLGSYYFESRHSRVDTLRVGIDILRVDILGVDIVGVDILRVNILGVDSLRVKIL